MQAERVCCNCQARCLRKTLNFSNALQNVSALLLTETSHIWIGVADGEQQISTSSISCSGSWYLLLRSMGTCSAFQLQMTWTTLPLLMTGCRYSICLGVRVLPTNRSRLDRESPAAIPYPHETSRFPARFFVRRPWLHVGANERAPDFAS